MTMSHNREYLEASSRLQYQTKKLTSSIGMEVCLGPDE